MNKELLFKILSSPPTKCAFGALIYNIPGGSFFVYKEQSSFQIEMYEPSFHSFNVPLDLVDYHTASALYLSAEKDLNNQCLTMIANHFSEDSEPVQVREVTINSEN